MEKQKNIIIAILLIIVALLIVALIIFWVSENGIKDNNVNIDDQNLDLDLIDEDLDGVVCTMDALECPDGTFVSRIAPNCEFASCPNGAVIDGGDANIDEIVDPLGAIDSYDSCVGAGFPIMETMPEQCITPDGRNFVNE